MNEEESVSEYDYYCVDCEGAVKPEDKVCPHCGADISEFVEEDEELQNEKNLPACPLCNGRSFQREQGTLSSSAFSDHPLILLVCEKCRYVLPFYDEGESIWDLR
jgi:RNA polymerase subunit RPABC4/transcription elongation factor Spt4